MNQAAMRMCLSDRAQTDQLMTIETLPTDGKTKPMANLRGKLPGNKKPPSWFWALVTSL